MSHGPPTEATHPVRLTWPDYLQRQGTTANHVFHPLEIGRPSSTKKANTVEKQKDTWKCSVFLKQGSVSEILWSQ